MARQRDRRAEYRARIERGRRIGLSPRQATGHAPKPPTAITRRAQYEALTPTQQDNYQLALQAVSFLRRGEATTLRDAANMAFTDEESVRFWAAAALTSRGGQVAAKPADRLLRPMTAIQAGVGKVDVDVHGSRAASTLGRYWAEVRDFLQTGDDSELSRFQGVRVAGIQLETDPNAILTLSLAGQVSFESIYQEVP